MYAFHPHGALLVVTDMDHKKFTGKMGKALAEFKFRRLRKHFMEPSDYDEIPLCKILYLSRGMDYWRNKVDGDI
jgi:hypothetical protein